MSLFTGSGTALVTPFNESGVDFAAFERLLDYQLKNSASALFVLGTTGEPATMTETEKEQVITYSVKKAAGRIKIIVGTGSNDTAKAVASSVKAEKLGADGVLAVTPYYNKCTQKGLIEYYKAVCSASPLPVIAYSVPSRTGVNILPETSEKLAEIKNLAGIKEASGNMAQVCEIMRRVRGKTDVFSGEDALNVPILAVGGEGVISVLSNIAPDKVKEIYSAVKKGNLQEANEKQDKLLPLISADFSGVRL